MRDYHHACNWKEKTKTLLTLLVQRATRVTKVYLIHVGEMQR